MFGSKSRLYLLLASSLVALLNLPAQADDTIALLNSKMVIAETLTQYPYRWDSKSTPILRRAIYRRRGDGEMAKRRFDRGV